MGSVWTVNEWHVMNASDTRELWLAHRAIHEYRGRTNLQNLYSLICLRMLISVDCILKMDKINGGNLITNYQNDQIRW